MSIEEQLRNLRPALDRAIGDAANVEHGPRSSSRSRAAVVAFAAAAAIAATVGVAVRLDGGGHHGISTRDTSTSTAVVGPSTTGVRSTTTSTLATTTTTTTTRPSVALSSVDWPSVVYPMQPQCSSVHPPILVLHVEYEQPAPDTSVAIVMVRCNAGAGSPPFAAYVYDGATSTTTPHLAATLIADTDGWRGHTFTASGSTVAIPASGYSSASIAHCCPDVFATLTWKWAGSAYQLQGSEPAHVPG